MFANFKVRLGLLAFAGAMDLHSVEIVFDAISYMLLEIAIVLHLLRIIGGPMFLILEAVAYALVLLVICAKALVFLA